MLAVLAAGGLGLGAGLAVTAQGTTSALATAAPDCASCTARHQRLSPGTSEENRP